MLYCCAVHAAAATQQRVGAGRRRHVLLPAIPEEVVRTPSNPSTAEKKHVPSNSPGECSLSFGLQSNVLYRCTAPHTRCYCCKIVSARDRPSCQQQQPSSRPGRIKRRKKGTSRVHRLSFCCYTTTMLLIFFLFSSDEGNEIWRPGWIKNIEISPRPNIPATT